MHAGGSSSSSRPRTPVAQPPKEPDAGLWMTHSGYGVVATDVAYRRLVRQAAATIVNTNGFDYVNTATLEILTYIANAYMATTCEGIKRVCEVASRTKANPSDTWVALAELGQDVNSLLPFLEQLHKTGNIVIPPPRQIASPKPSSPLPIGRNRPHPAYVDDFLPPFPDPHTYIKTEITGDPESSYEKVREQAAEVARENRKNVIDLMLRSYPSTCLYREFLAKATRHAQQILEDRVRSNEAMKAARQQALRKARVERELANVKELPGDLGDDILEDMDETSQDSVLDDFSDDEDNLDQFALHDTVCSMVRTRLSPACFVIEPLPEFRPYLACLVSEDGAEEDTFDGDSGKKGDDEVHVVDNAYLRPVRMLTQVDSAMMDH